MFQNISTGPHGVDFVIGNEMDYLQNLMSPNGVGGEGGLIDLIDFNVLASNKTFQRGSSFCSLRRVKLQNEDPTHFNVLASSRAF